MASMHVRRGEVYFVELGPTRGRELDLKRRPVVVVSSDSINAKPLVVTVIPDKTRRPGKQVFLNEVQVQPSPTNGLQRPTVFECFQIKALDHSRFDRRPAGVLAWDDVSLIEEAIRLCLGLT
jgi:mRNA interferase MazF